MTISHATFLALGSARWSVSWWRPPLFRALASHGARVLYFNLPRLWIPGRRTVSEHIDPSGVRVIQPRTLWPYKYGRRLALAASTHDWSTVPRAGVDFVWISHPEDAWIWNEFPEARRIYDAYDYYRSDHQGARARREFEATEVRAVRSADFVVAVSETLASFYHTLAAKNVLTLPNACPELSNPVPWANRRSLRAGLITNNFARVDWAFVRKWTDINQDWTLDIVGPGSPVWRRANVRWLGYLAGSHLQDTASSWNIGLLPYAATDFNYYCSPLKLFEYVAYGARVVANDAVASVRYYARRYPELVTVTASPQRVDGLLGARVEAVRRQFLSLESWNKRAETLLEFLG